MKLIIITLLIRYYFCTKIINLNSFSSFASGKDGIFNIDISKDDLNDLIHFVVFTIDGEMDRTIYYGFIDNINDPNNTILSYSKGSTYNEHFCTGDEDSDYSECGYKYYYDIKKKENKNYLRIKYSGYSGRSIYYDKMTIGDITFFVIFAMVIISCCAGLCFCFRYKRKKYHKINSTQESILIPQDNQPLETI